MLFQKLFTVFSLLAGANAIDCLASPDGKCSITISIPKNATGLEHGTAAVYDPSCNKLSHEVHVAENEDDEFKAGKSEVGVHIGETTFNATVHSRASGDKTVTEFYCSMMSTERDCSAYVDCNLFNKKRKFRA